MGLGPRVLGRPVELDAECVGCQQSPMRFPQHCAPEEDCVCRAVGEDPFCLLRMLNQANGAGPYARFPANSLSEADLIAGRQRILASGALPPLEQSIRSAPRSARSLDSWTVSSTAHPPTTQSVAETRTKMGRSAGHTPRTASKTSSNNRVRPTKSPP